MMTAGNAEGHAPQQAATCPTCKGSGQKRRAWDMTLLGGKRGRQEQICLACRGTGQVDPVRVCPACGQWIDVCMCPKSKIIKLWKVDEMNGVNWVQGQQRWRVEFSRGGTRYYMGQFEDKALAIGCRMVAENTPTEQLPALRQKYAELKKAAAKVVEPEPAETHNLGLTSDELAVTIALLDQDGPASDDVVEAEVPDLPADTLHQKLVAAREADQRFQVIREQYCAAERDAVDAWNEYARELAAYGQSDAFTRSYLGFLREEINRS